MGNTGSCQNPSSQEWSLPSTSSYSPVWSQTYKLPLYGLQCKIANYQANMNVSSTQNTPSDTTCFVTIGSNNCAPMDQCAACPSPSVTTSFNYTSCLDYQCSTQYSRCFDVACTTTCSVPDPSTTCPSGGTYEHLVKEDISSYYQKLQSSSPPTLPPRAICSYTPIANTLDPFPGTTMTQLVQLGLPDGFVSGAIARYVMYAFATHYNNDLYGDITTSFHQEYDFTNPQSYQSFIENIISQADIQNILSISPLAQKSSYVPSFMKSIQYLAQTHYLTVDSTGENYGMLFYSFGFTGKNGVGYTSQPSQADMINAIQNFTTETYSNIGSSSGLPTVSAPLNTFSYPPGEDFMQNQYYIFVDLNAINNGGKVVYNIGVPENSLQTIKQALSNTPSGDFYIVGRIFKIQITKMSLVLGYWFSTNFPNFLSPGSSSTANACTRLTSETSYMPSQCYTIQCGPGTDFNSSCKNIMIEACGDSSYLPINIFPSISEDMSLFYMTNSSQVCSCYNTRLRPAITGDSQRIPGMCFTGACVSNPGLMKAFSLTDKTCQSFCPTVYSWLTNPQNGSANRKYIDTQQYEKLCGANYIPSYNTKVNFPVLITSLLSCVVISFSVFWLYKSVPSTIIVCVAMLSVSLFLSFFLNGKSRCDPNIFNHQSLCYSDFLSSIFPKIFPSIKIPNLFCSYPLPCECVVDGQCPSDQICLSGMCISKSS